jgi:hypothetical protein
MNMPTHSCRLDVETEHFRRYILEFVLFRCCDSPCVPSFLSLVTEEHNSNVNFIRVELNLPKDPEYFSINLDQ